MSKPTDVEIFNDIVDSTTTTGYSYRNRNDIKPPKAFPVTSSPPRSRSTKRITKGYKTTSTVTMPAKLNTNHVPKPESPAPRITTEQNAAIRALRLEARRSAKSTPYVPKPRVRKDKVSAMNRRSRSPESVQILTFTEEHVEDVVRGAQAGGWLARGYRWYTSLVGSSVFTPIGT